MNILIIGVGYVGLVSGTCFSEMGHHVTCLDINDEHIQQLNQGIIPIYEPGLEEMVSRNIKAGRLSFVTNYAVAVPKANVIFIAVDTPMSSKGSADISRVETVAETLSEYIQQNCIVVTKSTVPVGTTLKIEEIIRTKLKLKNRNIEFYVVSNPEFLKEGNAIQDFMKPDRVIIGVNHEYPAAMMREIYSPFMLSHDRLIIMDILSAELSKYAANAMLATRISFMNEMALLCEKMGADVNAVRMALGSDSRIGHKFLYPGVGFGGSCFPKDINALLHQGKNLDFELSVLKAVHETNQRQKKIILNKLDSYFSNKNGITQKTIGILGLSFKPDTDDVREAPALELIEDLLAHHVFLRLYDPVAMNKAKKRIGNYPNIVWCESEIEVAEGADALVLMTEWKQFRFLNYTSLLSKMKGRAFFDGRNQCSPEKMVREGFEYFGIGRPIIN
ncbi:MAG: UDP-glucose/GDP-mannose dehydrogenase family protein [Parachlamydiaceae bacterium]|nr:UDP-glucose/GDP-mannose dehydrogenase family protein [Parachlamydiaceae bacterium]